jgi:hypothetical protein
LPFIRQTEDVRRPRHFLKTRLPPIQTSVVATCDDFLIHDSGARPQ